MDSANLAVVARRIHKTDPSAPVRRMRAGMALRQGDANGPAVARNRSKVHDDANGQRVLAGQELLQRAREDPARQAFEASLRETTDASDVAHTARDRAGLLLPARSMRGRGSPRLYPASLIVGGDAYGCWGVGPDSACEIGEWARAQFAREGIELGARRRSGDEWAMEAASRAGGGRDLLRLVEQETWSKDSPDEVALERAADRLLSLSREVTRNPGQRSRSVEGHSAP